MTVNSLVSIIINNYNYGRYLSEAIESALRQTYPYTEVIVVDDGSNDESRSVIDRFDGRIVAVLKENGGQASAFNAGFATSNGDIVIFLDADDILLPQIAGAVAMAFCHQPDAAKVMYRMAVVDAAGRPTGVIKPAPHLPLLSGDLRHHVLAFPDDIPWLPTSGNAFSVTTLRQILPMPESEYRILADFYLSHLTPLFGPVVGLPEIGAYYRVHGTNNYEVERIELTQVRRTIIHWRQTHKYISHFAYVLGLRDPTTPSTILSVAYVANRLVSLKLDPLQHPIPKESIWKIVREGITAARRRFDIAAPLRALFVAWFIVMAVVPIPLARRLAEYFFLPERRHSFNRLLRFWNQRPLAS